MNEPPKEWDWDNMPEERKRSIIEEAREYNERECNSLAYSLDISFHEASQLKYKIHDELYGEEDDDGHTIDYLKIEFLSGSPKKILNKIKGIFDTNKVFVYTGDWNNPIDYSFLDVKELEAINENKENFKNFQEEINSLALLIELPVSTRMLKRILYRQIYIGVIGTMETYLSDTFINKVLDNDDFFKRFIKTHPAFSKRKFDLRDIFDESEKIKDTAKLVMLETIYHKLPIVKNMYSDTFEISFPSIKKVYRYILQRHHLVHRNGKTKEGNLVKINKKTLRFLIKDMTKFIEDIESEFSK